MPYQFRNSFICLSCGQYNGFTADGGYNREIPEQHYTKLNPITNCVFSEENVYALKKSNGLCFGCNRNQELKILQLASFVADDEDNYSYEVEEYHRRLEKNYKLCERCERTVKRTLNQIKSRIVGAKIGENSKHAISSVATAQKRRVWAIKVMTYLSVVTTIFSFYQKIIQVRLSVDQLAAVIGQDGAEILFRTIAYILAVISLLAHYLVDNPIAEAAHIYLSSMWEMCQAYILPADPLDHDFQEIINIIGIIAGVILIILHKGRHLRALLTLVSVWSFNTLMHNHEILKGTIENPLIKIGESLLCFFATWAAFHLVSVPKSGLKCENNMNGSFHKICPTDISEAEESDNESDLNISTSSCFRSSINPHTSHLLNSTLKSVDLNGSTVNYSNNSMAASPFNNSSVIFADHHNNGSVHTLKSSTYFKGFHPNPFYNHLNLDRATPSEIGSCYRVARNNIIQPPKLSNDLTSPVSSWVAGGFFTTSPKKQTTPNTDFIPINSRTSSQSSGFESSAAFSREPSVAKELNINSRHSALSEPIGVVRPLRPQPIYPGVQNSSVIFAKPSPISPLLRNNGSFHHQSNISIASSSRPNSNMSGLDNRSIFGNCDDDRLYFKSNQSFRQQAWPNTRYTLPRGSIFNFKKFSKDLPTL